MSSKGLRKDRARGVALMQPKAMGRNSVHGLCSSRESLVWCVLRIDFAFSTFLRIGVCKEYIVSRLCQGIGLLVE